SPSIKKTDNSFILKNKYEIDDLFINRYKEDCILITGQVQSGKTRHIIEIIKRAIIEYKFNIIIVIGGYNNKLLKQTHERLKKELNKINPEDDIYFDFKVTEWKNDIERIDSNNIYNILKNTENLKSLLKLLKHQNKHLKNSKILIIDDECDFFSIQTLKSQKETENEENKIMNTSIYETLKNIYSQLKENQIDSLYINVTATPFANIINNYEENFGVKAIYSLPINDEYNGLKYFNDNAFKHFITSSFFFNNEQLKYINVIVFWLMQTIIYLKTTGNKESELIIFDSIQKYDHFKTFNIIKENIRHNSNSFKDSFYFLKSIYDEFKSISID
ncbi:MAG: DEAD/DEAH box helicase family protein, partial [Ureaplasma sp.]|nr:DEAD/DEAH box helicase family protein [Ureaplasma sp.]